VRDTCIIIGDLDCVAAPERTVTHGHLTIDPNPDADEAHR
jgi:hypothetical protein